jgi:hypothetical protein
MKKSISQASNIQYAQIKHNKRQSEIPIKKHQKRNSMMNKRTINESMRPIQNEFINDPGTQVRSSIVNVDSKESSQFYEDSGIGHDLSEIVQRMQPTKNNFQGIPPVHDTNNSIIIDEMQRQENQRYTLNISTSEVDMQKIIDSALEYQNQNTQT